MVVFTCGHCGESVQKPKVEKHYLTKCRNRNPNLSCMDCFKDFYGQDYESHIKCITEEERYSGKGFTPKEKKGEKKQTVWVEMLQAVLDEQKDAPRNVLRIVETISKHNNTPRKKPKFINFVKNVCGHKTSPKDIDQAWELIAVKLSALSTNNNQNKNNDESKTNGETEDVTNGDVDENGTEIEKLENDTNGIENGTNGVENGTNGVEHGESENGDKENIKAETVNDKKLTKKQRKEEKKKLKYAAELQSAEAPPSVEEEEESDTTNKKNKKKKNRTESVNNDEENIQNESKKEKKKRKRQDTTGSAVEVVVTTTEKAETAPTAAEKAQKKKLKVNASVAEADDSVCLHDQNVANGEEAEETGVKSDKFNWHTVILSVLEKKGNELPFKRLQKKVLSEYSEMTGREVDDRIADKFIKRLKSAPKVKVVKNTVYLEE